MFDYYYQNFRMVKGWNWYCFCLIKNLLLNWSCLDELDVERLYEFHFDFGYFY